MPKTQAQPCMICGELPCSCFPSVKKKAAPKQPKAAPVEKTKPKLVAPKQDAPPPRPVRATTQSLIRAAHEKESEEEEQVHRAIRALEPLLHPAEKTKYKDILEAPRRRAAQWRERRKSNG